MCNQQKDEVLETPAVARSTIDAVLRALARVYMSLGTFKTILLLNPDILSYFNRSGVQKLQEESLQLKPTSSSILLKFFETLPVEAQLHPVYWSMAPAKINCPTAGATVTVFLSEAKTRTDIISTCDYIPF